MKIKFVSIFLAILISTILLFPTDVFGCVLTLKPSTTTIEVGESVTFTLTRTLTHKTCILPLEETKYEVKGGTIVSLSKWTTSASGDTQEIIVRFDIVGEGVLKVMRDCSKVGLMTTTSTVKVIEKPSTEPPPVEQPKEPIINPSQPTQPTTPTTPPTNPQVSPTKPPVTSSPTIEQPSVKETESGVNKTTEQPLDVNETNNSQINETSSESQPISENENENSFAWLKTLLTIQNGIIITLLLFGSIFFNKKYNRYLRGVSLIISLALLGFYYEGCPCLVGYIDRLIVLPFGSTLWIAIVVTLVILTLFTLFRGRIYCGYVCPMGAAQEFLFNEKRSIKIPQKVNKYLRMLKYVVLVSMIIYALVYSQAIYCSLDPFKVMFNFTGSGFPLYLLIIVILSSLFVYRPFCQVLCPMGALLSLTSRLGKFIGINRQNISLECIGCKLCSRVCPVSAIEVKDKTAVIESGECLTCGQCFEKCPK